MTQQGRVVAILGCGFMGSALLDGILSSTPTADSQVGKYFACVQKSGSAQRLQSQFQNSSTDVEVICNDNARAVAAADTVILGFQPGDAKNILGTPQMSKDLEGKLIISMLAGVTCEKIGGILASAGGGDPSGYSIIRVVPSIGAQINESMSLISESKLDASEVSFVEWMFGRVGGTQIVSEDLVDTSVAVSATCHALTVTAVDAVVDGSVSRGLPRSVALKIAAQCLRSASSLLLEKMTLEELKDSMSVPRGITTEAWIHLDKGNVRPALSQTVREAVDYANRMA